MIFATFVKKNYEKNELLRITELLKLSVIVAEQYRRCRRHLIVSIFINILLAMLNIFCIFAEL